MEAVAAIATVAGVALLVTITAFFALCVVEVLWDEYEAWQERRRTRIEAELDAGWTSGMLCSKRKGFSSLHANYRRPREEFIADCRDALLAAAPKPEGGAT